MPAAAQAAERAVRHAVIWRRISGGTDSTVAEAISIAQREEFDILICDLELPDGNGHALLRELRAQGRAPAKAVVLSGYDSPSDIEESLEAGFLRHLIKPIRFEELLGVM